MVQVRKAGNTKLKWGQAVLSVKNPSQKWVYNLKVGQTFDLTTQVVKPGRTSPAAARSPRPAAWSEITEAQGGNYFTLKGKQDRGAIQEATYPSGVQRHPRTGLGVTADGRVLMVTVDGRRKKSKGVTLGEMGQLMRSLGAVHAFNLDGGGSTVMARHMVLSKKFQVANKPSDGKQRPATQAFAVFRVVP